MNSAYIIFTVAGRRYLYDGDLPHPFDYGVGPYPDALYAQEKEPGDTLPTALFEISQIGGQVIEIVGARPSGAIFAEDWLHPRIY